MLNQKELFKKSISLIIGVVIISFALSFWAIAWTEPVQVPPAGNAQAPLNVGSTGQNKQGWLATLDSLWVGMAGQDPAIPGENIGLLATLKGALLNVGGGENGLLVDKGKVGIGTLTPTDGFKMEVNGDIKLTGDTPTFKISNVAAPVSDSDVATKGWVDAYGGGSSFGLRFAGYTGLSTGNLGKYKGANQKCGTAFPAYNNATNSVHWCSVNELMELGNQYPFTYSVWARDAIRGIMWRVITGPWTVYGGAGATSTMFAAPDEAVADCINWTNSTPPPGIVWEGPMIFDSSKGGRIGVGNCYDSYRLACCYYGE